MRRVVEACGRAGCAYLTLFAPVPKTGAGRRKVAVDACSYPGAGAKIGKLDEQGVRLHVIGDPTLQTRLQS